MKFFWKMQVKTMLHILWNRVLEWSIGMEYWGWVDWWSGAVEFSIGVECWSGVLEWNVGVEYLSGVVVWIIGVSFGVEFWSEGMEWNEKEYWINKNIFLTQCLNKIKKNIVVNNIRNVNFQWKFWINFELSLNLYKPLIVMIFSMFCYIHFLSIILK